MQGRYHTSLAGSAATSRLEDGAISVPIGILQARSVAPEPADLGILTPCVSRRVRGALLGALIENVGRDKSVLASPGDTMGAQDGPPTLTLGGAPLAGAPSLTMTDELGAHEH